MLAGELYAANGDHTTAFQNYEKIMRPFVEVNQNLARKAAKLMKTKERKTILSWLTKKMLDVLPGAAIKFVLDLATRRMEIATEVWSLVEHKATETARFSIRGFMAIEPGKKVTRC